MDELQRAEVERLVAEDRALGRGKRLALGVMFGAEAGVVGAALTTATGGFWLVGAAAGAAVTGLLALGYRRIPVERRARWAARTMQTR